MNLIAKTTKSMVNDDAVVQVITKKDLRDIRKYEKRGRFRFKHAPSDEFLRDMPEGEILPIAMAMEHNGTDIRCEVMCNRKGDSMLVDMPSQIFLGLQQRNRKTGELVKEQALHTS